MTKNPFTIIVGLLMLAIVGLLLFSFQVRKSEVVVVTTFGKPTRTITEPGGPYARLPWPVQSVHRFDQRVQNFEDKFTEGLTADSFNLLASVYVGWKITEPQAFFPKFASTADPIAAAEQVMDRMLGGAKTAVIGNHPLADFLAPAGEGNKFAAIEQEILNLVQAEVRAQNYGLEIQFLGVKKLGLPESVTTSVFERMKSERKVLADRSEFEGVAEAQKIRSEADRKASELLSTAEAQATEIRGKGEAEAIKSLKVFQQNPELASFIFRLSALEGSLKGSTLIFDQQTPPFDLLTGVSVNPTNLLHK
ncbi:MAG TPA: protease modulator HflC [Candidatus Binatia bacterium]|jgi:membrane protease subunit HflC|nr:protease modulator HflC [Candidatus Binatia bacterium]